jgi:hypothetical protein
VSDVALSGDVLDVLDIDVLGFSVPIGLPSGVRARRKGKGVADDVDRG